MHARSALFDLYGDHLRSRGGSAPVAALVRLLTPLGVAPPAVRTAVSRMVRQGWLVPVRLPPGPGYAVTPAARHRLDDAAARIYRTRQRPWSGSWDLLVVQPVRSRVVRERLRSGLAYHGYAPLSDSTWIGPVESAEAVALVQGEGVGLARFAAHDDAPGERAAQAWDIEALAASYRSWLGFARRLVEHPEDLLPSVGELSGVLLGEDERDFAVRSLLVHEWRKFLFADPGLPAELLPDRWPGTEAAAFFAAEAERLLPAAARHVERCLTSAPSTAASGART